MNCKNGLLGYLSKEDQEQIRKDIEERWKEFSKNMTSTENVTFDTSEWPRICKPKVSDKYFK